MIARNNTIEIIFTPLSCVKPEPYVSRTPLQHLHDCLVKLISKHEESRSNVKQTRLVTSTVVLTLKQMPYLEKFLFERFKEYKRPEIEIRQ